MEISLIRHGKSLCSTNKLVSYSSFREWVKEYDRVGVSTEDTYPSVSIEKVSAGDLVFTTRLK